MHSGGVVGLVITLDDRILGSDWIAAALMTNLKCSYSLLPEWGLADLRTIYLRLRGDENEEGV